MKFFFVLLSLAHTVFSTSPSALLDSGPIVGVTTYLPGGSSKVNQFLGVPFAQSPPKRFSLPEKPESWRSPLNATTRKPSCIQQINYPEAARNFSQTVFNNPPPPESEDCLYLNVWAPSTPAPPGGRAVLFWIYGGSFRLGNGGQPYYDGSHFAAFEDVIVVTHNYRINVFGFPASPEIPLDKRNVGLYDQRLALDWVQRNIHTFGGDPSKVTIFGESAGGTSVDMLVTSFTTETAPFRAAILQSGQNSYLRASTSNAGTDWSKLVANVSCTNAPSQLDCVRSVSADEVRDALQYNQLAFMPYVDNKTVVRFPTKAREDRTIATVPILGGSNADDGSVFANGLDNLTKFLDGNFPGDSALQNAVAALYPLGENGLFSVRDIINQILTELGFQCNLRRLTEASNAAGIPTWRYYYNASFPNLAYPQYGDLGVYHSSEINSVFSTYPRANATHAQKKLSNSMRGAWAQFAKDPAAGPGWNAVGSDAADLQVLGSGDQATTTTISPGEVDIRCPLYDALYDAVSAA